MPEVPGEVTLLPPGPEVLPVPEVPGEVTLLPPGPELLPELVIPGAVLLPEEIVFPFGEVIVVFVFPLIVPVDAGGGE